MRRTSTVGNAVLGAGFALVLLVMAAQYASQGRVWALDAATGAVVCALALGRERHRGGAAALGLAVAGAAALVARLTGLPGEPGAAAVVGLLVLGGSAVRTLPWRSAAALGVAGLALMTAGLLAAQAPATPFRVGIEVWALALAAGLGLRLLDHRRRAAAEAARQDERLALARELHDLVAHHITGVVVQAQAARIVARSRPEQLDETLAGIETAGADALSAMRRVVGLLRAGDDTPGTAPAAPGAAELAALVERFEGHGPAVRLRLPDRDATPWPPEVATTVHRIVQESLTNVARHAAHARTAEVAVAHAPGALTVTVTDDAPPAPARHLRPVGFGLLGMRERVEALGGTFTAGPGPTAGWTVHAELPVSAGDAR
ncbi:sensor histidine kinase [Kitasatospora griseola]|uniref:sensor histidine kinase n=1 Tax=Kitasatospora griseola TaxID=2064 RepID=UPI001910DFAF|nr:histidine kinase [Kitasatospora griseola]